MFVRFTGWLTDGLVFIDEDDLVFRDGLYLADMMYIDAAVREDRACDALLGTLVLAGARVYDVPYCHHVSKQGDERPVGHVDLSRSSVIRPRMGDLAQVIEDRNRLSPNWARSHQVFGSPIVRSEVIESVCNDHCARDGRQQSGCAVRREALRLKLVEAHLEETRDFRSHLRRQIP